MTVAVAVVAGQIHLVLKKCASLCCKKNSGVQSPNLGDLASGNLFDIGKKKPIIPIAIGNHHVFDRFFFLNELNGPFKFHT